MRPSAHAPIRPCAHPPMRPCAHAPSAHLSMRHPPIPPSAHLSPRPPWQVKIDTEKYPALASQYSITALPVKIDTEKYPALASQYSITALPTIVLFRHGHPIDRIVSRQRVVVGGALGMWLEMGWGGVVRGGMRWKEGRSAVSQYGITALPTIVLFRHGHPVERIEGWGVKRVEWGLRREFLSSLPSCPFPLTPSLSSLPSPPFPLLPPLSSLPTPPSPLLPPFSPLPSLPSPLLPPLSPLPAEPSMPSATPLSAHSPPHHSPRRAFFPLRSSFCASALSSPPPTHASLVTHRRPLPHTLACSLHASHREAARRTRIEESAGAAAWGEYGGGESLWAVINRMKRCRVRLCIDLSVAMAAAEVVGAAGSVGGAAGAVAAGNRGVGVGLLELPSGRAAIQQYNTRLSLCEFPSAIPAAAFPADAPALACA
ncbi:unnamed protein product [Closterium sp. Naga37s-1]|nr:unnamed protein product [Closterium sp. Naga37s-1]